MPAVPDRPFDPSALRISDEDRHKVAELLRDAAGEGRLDLAELDERLEATYAAKVYADLVPITADLPTRGDSPLPPGATSVPAPRVGHPSVPASFPVARYDRSLVVMGGVDRKGYWQIGETHTAFAMWGGIVLDLREVQFTARETVIYANAIWGGVDIIVNPYTVVVVEGVGIMGAFAQSRDRAAPMIAADAPVVRVKGLALMAGVTITRRPLPGDEPRGLLARLL